MKKYLFSLFLTLFSLNHAYAGSGDDLEALLSIDGVNNQQSNENSMPYKVECKQTREDTVKCTLEKKAQFTQIQTELMKPMKDHLPLR